MSSSLRRMTLRRSRACASSGVAYAARVCVRIAAACVAFLALSCGAGERVVRLVSLDWQPYSGAALPEQGAAAAVVKAAFQAEGYTVDIDFYPWARAMHLVENADEYDGIFPVYHSAARARWLNCGSSLGSSPLGFAERRAAPVAWSTLADLGQYKIGVVRDYVNTEAFDSMVAAGRIDADVAGSDVQNLQKLAHGRIDLAVIDRNVLERLLKSPTLRSLLGGDAQGSTALQFNRRVLENKELYICFKRNDADERIANAFAAGLRKIDAEAIVVRYLRELARSDAAGPVSR
jgi:polar amino acid transport system substrate-binding protein